MSNTIKTLEYTELIGESGTGLSWLFRFGDDPTIINLPKSVTEDIRETAMEVDIPLWMVEDRGLEDFIK